MADLSKLREALKEMDSSDSEADFRRASEQVIKEARKVVRVREVAAQADAKPAEPIGWVFQHGETGRMTFCANDGTNTPEVFQTLNPHHALVGSAYISAQPAVAARDGVVLDRDRVESLMQLLYSASNGRQNIFANSADDLRDLLAAAKPGEVGR